VVDSTSLLRAEERLYLIDMCANSIDVVRCSGFSDTASQVSQTTGLKLDGSEMLFKLIRERKAVTLLAR